MSLIQLLDSLHPIFSIGHPACSELLDLIVVIWLIYQMEGCNVKVACSLYHVLSF